MHACHPIPKCTHRSIDATHHQHLRSCIRIEHAFWHRCWVLSLSSVTFTKSCSISSWHVAKRAVFIGVVLAVGVATENPSMIQAACQWQLCLHRYAHAACIDLGTTVVFQQIGSKTRMGLGLGPKNGPTEMAVSATSTQSYRLTDKGIDCVHNSCADHPSPWHPASLIADMYLGRPMCVYRPLATSA